jgi:hypothetical protein
MRVATARAVKRPKRAGAEAVLGGEVDALGFGAAVVAEHSADLAQLAGQVVGGVAGGRGGAHDGVGEELRDWRG